MDEAEVEATGKTIARRLLARIGPRQSFNKGLKNNAQLRTVKKTTKTSLSFTVMKIQTLSNYFAEKLLITRINTI